MQQEFSAALTNSEFDSALGASPSLANGIPNREIEAGQIDSDGLTLTRVKQDIRESLQKGRGFSRGSGMLDVKLRNLGRYIRFIYLTQFQYDLLRHQLPCQYW